jgi:hypothetical protein
MAEVLVDLIVEDSAQERFIGGLVERLAGEREFTAVIRPISVVGGRPAAAGAVKVHARINQLGAVSRPHLLVIGNDGNCSGWNARKQEVLGWCPETPNFEIVAVCPEPHIERWYFLDLPLFHQVVGPCNAPPKSKCEKLFYKTFLRAAAEPAGSLLGGVEFADEIAKKMNINAAKSADASFDAAVTELRAVFRRLTL